MESLHPEEGPVVGETIQEVPTAENVAILDQIQGFLKSRDDTSRFVGLALLKSALDTQSQLRENGEQLRSLWGSLSPKFLDRLLRARQNKKISKDDGKEMVVIAVAVLHTFAVLLPSETRSESKFSGRLPALLNALLHRYF